MYRKDIGNLGVKYGLFEDVPTPADNDGENG
jgi:hypothetical protein